MTLLLFVTTIIVLLVTILTMLMLGISSKHTKSKETRSPYECGFDPQKKARSPFSLRFFHITLIFLIFEVEIALLLPLGYLLNQPLLPPSVGGLIVTLILLVGVVHEWKQGALNWL
uniref:NADH-ubiquinone oxidoreductase chain 3 n=1 Tax=Pseudocrangonyx daejeonensis TaxID=2038767 RepID=A0A346SAG0_9CRUS|nr:NADH dehydrogenase subunit 3 [Pseudocrangonyx daejeonensis]AXT17548.1 NADH dehydrogenase subunit 3 [Pseudocrangonyx daejeonensis]